MKKVIAGLLSFILTALIATTALAAPPQTVQPMWKNVISVTPTIYASTDEYACEIYAIEGTSRIACTLTLYEEKSPGSDAFIYKSSLTDTYNGSQHIFRKSCAIEEGLRYKIVVSASVTRNGYAEPISLSWIKQC